MAEWVVVVVASLAYQHIEHTVFTFSFSGLFFDAQHPLARRPFFPVKAEKKCVNVRNVMYIEQKGPKMSRTPEFITLCTKEATT